MLKDLEIADLAKIESIHNIEKRFPLPDLTDQTYIIKKTIFHDDDVVGAAFGRISSEISLILNPNLLEITRAKLWKQVTEEIIFEILQNGINNIHAFLLPENDENHAKALEKYFGFQRATGIPMFLEVKPYGKRANGNGD